MYYRVIYINLFQKTLMIYLFLVQTIKLIKFHFILVFLKLVVIHITYHLAHILNLTL